MKVYVVAKDWGYYGSDNPEAVFSSKEKAVEYVDKWYVKGEFPHFYVFEMEVDGPVVFLVYQKP